MKTLCLAGFAALVGVLGCSGTDENLSSVEAPVGLVDFEPLGGNASQRPTALALGVDNLHVFIASPDGHARARSLTPSGWWPAAGEWADLGAPPGGGAVATSISASTWGSGRIDLVARASGNKLLTKSYTPGSGWHPSFSTWSDLGPTPNGPLAASPKIVSWGPGRLDIFMKGSNAGIHQKTYTANANWSEWVDRGGSAASDPVVVSWGSDRIDLFVRDLSGHLRLRSYGAAGWGSWYDLGDGVVGEPAVVTWGVNRLDIFMRGTDGQVKGKNFNGSGWYPSQTGWFDMGGPAGGDPSAVTWGPNRLDIFVQTQSNGIMAKTFSNGTWAPSLTGWYGLLNGPGGANARPSVVTWGPDRIDLFSTAEGNSVLRKHFNGIRWEPCPTC